MTLHVNAVLQGHSADVPPAAHAVLSSDEIRLLTEVGFLAAAAADVPSAEAIFGPIRQLRPGRLFPVLGLAVAWMNAGRAAEAADLLASAQCADADECATRDVWHGFALQLAGRMAQSRDVLQRAVTDHGARASFARGLLGLGSDMP